MNDMEIACAIRDEVEDLYSGMLYDPCTEVTFWRAGDSQKGFVVIRTFRLDTPWLQPGDEKRSCV